MRENFDRGLALLVDLEGGETHHVPGDPGGLTSGLGVTQSTYDRYRQNKSLPLRTVADIEGKEAREIFKKGYWDICHCDDIPADLDLVVFAYAVNRGPVKSIKLMQRALGVKSDGDIGY